MDALSAPTAEARYQAQLPERAEYLKEAEQSASLTLPSLIPDDQDICTRTTVVNLVKPYQSLGSRGVNNLGSKLLLTLFPPTSPFLRYQLSPIAKRDAKVEKIDMGPIQGELAMREATIQGELDVQGIRSKLYAGIKHLLVAGNVAIRKVKGKGLQIFPLNSYVAKRDTEGNLIEAIIVEKFAKSTITDKRVLDILSDPASSIDARDPHHAVKVFTSIRRVPNSDDFRVVQEVGGIEVPDTAKTYKPRKLPWLILRYTSIDGEDYGRGFVEEYRGDLTSYESLSRDMIFASANAAKLLWGVDPTSTVNLRHLTDLENGQFFGGREGEIWALKMDKGGDMQVAQTQLAKLEQSLAADFLLNSSFQRKGERVTAEEIRLMASELEDTLGGVFSLLGQELQLPLGHLLEDELISTNALQPLDEKTVKIGVVTGLAAIGRGQDLTRLKEAIASVAEVATFMPGLIDYINEGALNTRIWTGTGVDTEGLILSDDEVAKKRSERAQQQAQQTMGEEMAKGAAAPLGQVAADGMRAQREIPTPQGAQ
ncbi:MAG: portal protein [Dehalococcoidia bacterium]